MTHVAALTVDVDAAGVTETRIRFFIDLPPVESGKVLGVMQKVLDACVRQLGDSIAEEHPLHLARFRKGFEDGRRADRDGSQVFRPNKTVGPTPPPPGIPGEE